MQKYRFAVTNFNYPGTLHMTVELLDSKNNVLKHLEGPMELGESYVERIWVSFGALW